MLMELSLLGMSKYYKHCRTKVKDSLMLNNKNRIIKNLELDAGLSPHVFALLISVIITDGSAHYDIFF